MQGQVWRLLGAGFGLEEERGLLGWGQQGACLGVCAAPEAPA